MSDSYDPFAAEKFVNPLVKQRVEALVSLPKRAIESSAQSLQSGQYDPAVPLEAAALVAGAGSPFAETGALGAAGGRLVTMESKSGPKIFEAALADERAAPKAANDIDAFQAGHAATYEAARRAQSIEHYVDKNTHVGDYDYWAKMSVQHGYLLNDKPSANSAARAFSEGGRTTLLINPGGRRIVYHDGLKVIRESMNYEQKT